MALVRYRQGDGGMTRLRDEMSDLFRNFFEGWDMPLAQTSFAPALDVTENKDSITVKAELPGIKVEDIDIAVENNVLAISGEKKEEQEEKGESFHHVERRYGMFRRNIPLPATVDPQKINATYKDGILRVTLPKTESAKPRKIEVKVEK